MEDNPFSHFPIMDPPSGEPLTPENIIGRPIQGVDYEVSLMVRPSEMTGRHIAESVWYAHEAIGGNIALAQWALVNRTKFYTTILAKMLPQASSPLMSDQREVRFRLAVPVKTIDITDVEEIASGTSAPVEIIPDA